MARVNYSDKQRARAVQFIKEYDTEHKRGGLAQATKKFNIAFATLKNWLNANGKPTAAKKPAKEVATKKTAKEVAVKKPVKEVAAKKPAIANAQAQAIEKLDRLYQELGRQIKAVKGLLK